ncbi:hypothetical protein D3C85_1289160 [compost metagenome]
MAVEGPLLLISKLVNFLTIVTASASIGSSPASDGVKTAVLVSVPVNNGSTVPLTLTRMVPLTGTSAVRSTLFPVPVAPLLITAPPVAVLVHETTLIAEGTTSISLAAVAFDGPALLIANV